MAIPLSSPLAGRRGFTRPAMKSPATTQAVSSSRPIYGRRPMPGGFAYNAQPPQQGEIPPPQTAQPIPAQVAPAMPATQAQGNQLAPMQQVPQAQPQAYQGYVPQTGLIGSEQALKQGLAGALAGLSEGIGQGQADVKGAMSSALGQLRQAGAQASGAYGQGVSALNPYSQMGVQGQNLQAALAGLQGQEAFNQALMDSPATRFLQEQGERAALRTAAARGGLGGGNVMKELSRFNTGLAAQDLQNQYARAQGLATQGLQAAGQIGQLRGQEGSMLAGLGQTGAGIQGQLGQALGQMGLAGGQFAGQAALGTGQQMAADRLAAGQQIASAISGTSSELGKYMQQQGAGISDITSQQASNLANLLSGAGQQAASSDEQLAALLSNLSQGAATQISSMPIVATQGSNLLGQVGQVAEGVGTMMSQMDKK